MNPFGIAKYVAEVANGDQLNPESMDSTYTQSRSGIQSTQSGIKIIGFTKSEKGQAGEPVEDKNVIAYLADIPVVANDNRLPFQNNVEYA